MREAVESANAPKPVEKPSEEPKLSPAELKKKAKAEKQARRAAQKEQQGVSPGQAPIANGPSEERKTQKSQPSGEQKSKGEQQKKQQTQQKSSQSSGQQAQHHVRTGSIQQGMPLRRRPSHSGTAKESVRKDSKQIELFSHLYTHPRRRTIEGTSRDVHPAVLALGCQFSSYEICGSSARCVAMLLAFKEAIEAYVTPPDTSLPRHLNSHYLSPQIDYLRSCRPISMSMGNAIRWLKNLIGKMDPAIPDSQAKEYLHDEIDRFIHERITISDQVIAASASCQIRNGAVVLTYAKSSIVEKAILQAHENGTKFRVVVLDSRPLFEGKQLATSLVRAGLEVEYLPFSGIAHAVKEASIIFLGAHSMLSNGRLQSRIGTASVAMAAHRADIPVIVCCESVKFSDKVALDSIVVNEVAPSEELFMPQAPRKPVAVPAGGKKEEEGEDDGKTRSLHDWKDIAGLQILNLMYDVTPAEHIRMVICEYGSVPPSSVPVVHRLANEGM